MPSALQALLPLLQKPVNDCQDQKPASKINAFWSTYLSCISCRYNIKDLDNIQNLQKTHQKMAQVLQAAERAGILEAHLAVVTHREYCSYEATHYGGYEEPEVHDSETHVGNWRTLDGVNPGWEAVIMDPYGQDEILQVKHIHSAWWQSLQYQCLYQSAEVKHTSDAEPYDTPVAQFLKPRDVMSVTELPQFWPVYMLVMLLTIALTALSNCGC